MAEEIETVEVPEKFKKLVEEVEKMSVLDLAELVKVLEKKFGVSAAPQMMAAAAAPAAAGAAAEEKSSFNVVLTSAGDKKIEVIKVVRDLTQKGLKEAKDLVDAIATAPQTIKEDAKKEEAEEMKKKFVEAGATVELK
jgi:large subunit ribosomal protein L7/L12